MKWIVTPEWTKERRPRLHRPTLAHYNLRGDGSRLLAAMIPEAVLFAAVAVHIKRFLPPRGIPDSHNLLCLEQHASITCPSDADTSPLAALDIHDKVRGLTSVRAATVTTLGLKRIVSCGAPLRSLAVFRSPVNSAGLREIFEDGMEHLRVLSLSHCGNLCADVFAVIASKLPHLTDLDVSAIAAHSVLPLTKGLPHLAPMVTAPATDEGVPIPALDRGNLTALNLSQSNRLTDLALVRLVLDGDHGASHAAGLVLDAARVMAGTVADAEMTTPNAGASRRWSAEKVIPASAAYDLCHRRALCVTLTTLDLSGSTDLTNGAAHVIALLGRLRTLSLARCPRIGDPFLAHLAGDTPAAQVSPFVSSEDLVKQGELRAPISPCPTPPSSAEAPSGLQRLGHGFKTTVPGVTPVAASLTALNVSQCAALSDAAMGSLAKFPALRRLELCGLKRLTKPGMAPLEAKAGLEINLWGSG